MLASKTYSNMAVKCFHGHAAQAAWKTGRFWAELREPNTDYLEI